MLKIFFLSLSIFCGIIAPAWGEDPHQEERPLIKLSRETLEEFGIRLAKATLRDMPRTVELPGEVVLNPDLLVHIVPVASGFVRKVFKEWGDRVTAGEVLAVIDSPELADLKASYLSARIRLRLAEELFQREKALWRRRSSRKNPSSRPARNSSWPGLKSRPGPETLNPGLFPERLCDFERGGRPLGRYELRSPLAGLVVEKYLVRGEMVGPERVAFQIADLSEV